MRLAIADPPYPPRYAERRDRPDGPIRLTTRSRSRRYYGDGTRPAGERPADFHPDAAEWDDPDRHRQLLEDLDAEFDGWAIATSSDGLSAYHPLPVSSRVMVWHRPTAQPGNNRVVASWEAVVVSTPEARRGGKGAVQVRDVLTHNAPKDGFTGAKPAAWVWWVLAALGYDPEADELVDVFPGSGAIGRHAAQGVLL